MAVADEDIAAVRAATDLVALISENVQLRKVGRRWTGLCPFHSERTPSFSVNGEEGFYFCFGCGAKGDAISYVRETEHLDFVEAIERLAARANITLTKVDEKAAAERSKRKKLSEVMGRAVDFYHSQLLESSEGAQARAYLRSRGYDGEIVRAYQLGWSPEGWDNLARYLNVSDELLGATGLGFVNRRKRQQDAFRGRVIFPIFDASGSPVALGGRILGKPSENQPKYKNSPETALYSKRRTLYGLNWAKDEAARLAEVVVCEGYTDVIGFAIGGIRRAVATCGTALSEDHVRLLRNYARKIVLAFDADAAGQAAAERFYAWEKQYDVDLYVANLPEGSDPGDLARRAPDLLAQAVDNAQPFLGFRIGRHLSRSNLATPEGRARAADAALGMVAEHPNELVRDQYVMQVGDATHLAAEDLRARLRRGTTKQNSALGAEARKARRANPEALRDGPELELLRLAITSPEAVAQELCNLSPAVEDPVSQLAPLLFTDDRYLATFLVLARAETLHDAVDNADASIAELIQRLSVEETEAEVADVCALLVLKATQRALERQASRSRRGDSPGGEEVIDLREIKSASEAVLEPDGRANALALLVPWVVSCGEGE